jgi:3-hydroxyisobutyrate dehydrogenase
MANALAKDMMSAVPMAGLGAELMRQHASKGFNEQDPCTLIEMYVPDNNNNNGAKS